MTPIRLPSSQTDAKGSKSTVIAATCGTGKQRPISTSTWCLGSVLGGKVHVRPARSPIRKPLPEGCHADLPFRIVRGEVREHADAPYPLRLLRAPRAATKPE